MNAQSSRSHAIFSLTLVQRKYRGSGLPPRSSSPLPPNGRSPSRLARPGSILAGQSGNRVSSPTFGRPGTPSMPSAMGRTSMLRPASSLGHHDARGSLDDESGDWVTVVSKFHFVDLAGSERVSVVIRSNLSILTSFFHSSRELPLWAIVSKRVYPSTVAC
jgi:hypothetical protein